MSLMIRLIQLTASCATDPVTLHRVKGIRFSSKQWVKIRDYDLDPRTRNLYGREDSEIVAAKCVAAAVVLPLFTLARMGYAVTSLFMACRFSVWKKGIGDLLYAPLFCLCGMGILLFVPWRSAQLARIRFAELERLWNDDVPALLGNRECQAIDREWEGDQGWRATLYAVKRMVTFPYPIYLAVCFQPKSKQWENVFTLSLRASQVL